MPQIPPFTLTGSPYFEDISVSFKVLFGNPGDEAAVQAYEWYLDGVIVIDAAGQVFTGEVACGSHAVAVRVLSGDSWTGVQGLAFETCRLVTSAFIAGPANVVIGESEAYEVIWQFSDGTTANMTAQYTFGSTAGGSFAGNLFTATGDGSGDAAIGVTITASSTLSADLTKGITVANPNVNSAGVLVVDFFNNSSLNVIGFINNAGVTENHVAAYTGVNIIPVGAAASNALIITSDFINQSVLNWRFQFNLLKLKTDYPATTSFVFSLMGRAAVAGTLNGAYVLQNEAAQMVLGGSPGSYLPSTTGGVDLSSPVNFGVPVVAGANGSYAEGDLTLIMELTFSVADNSVSYVGNTGG